LVTVTASGDTGFDSPSRITCPSFNSSKLLPKLYPESRPRLRLPFRFLVCVFQSNTTLAIDKRS
jgi:hypothetical protein